MGDFNHHSVFYDLIYSDFMSLYDHGGQHLADSVHVLLHVASTEPPMSE